MEQKRQKVENLFLKHIWLVCQKEEEKVVLLTSLHVHVLIKNKERMMHKIISKSAVWFSRFNSYRNIIVNRQFPRLNRKKLPKPL